MKSTIDEKIIENMKNLDKHTFAQALRGKSPEEIDMITKHSISGANDIRCMHEGVIQNTTSYGGVHS